MSEFITIPLTQDKVALIDADDLPLIGQFKWYATRSTKGKTFYAKRSISQNRKEAMHRMLLGALPDQQVDHRNGNGLDNRRSNIRIATVVENQCNRQLTANNTSGFKGVCFHTRFNRWIATIRVNRRSVHIGYFTTPEDAARAYDKSAVELHGEFAWLNFPEEITS